MFSVGAERLPHPHQRHNHRGGLQSPPFLTLVVLFGLVETADSAEKICANLRNLWFFFASFAFSLRLCVNLGVFRALGDLGASAFLCVSVSSASLR